MQVGVRPCLGPSGAEVPSQQVHRLQQDDGPGLCSLEGHRAGVLQQELCMGSVSRLGGVGGSRGLLENWCVTYLLISPPC